MCVCVYVCSVWKIRPQKMLIRVDLGTWSCRLMDRVQGQTSPWGAMILSLIVHTHLPSPLTLHPLNTHTHMLTYTPLLYTHHRQNKSVSDTTGKEKKMGVGGRGRPEGVKERAVLEEEMGGAQDKRWKTHRGMWRGKNNSSLRCHYPYKCNMYMKHRRNVCLYFA